MAMGGEASLTVNKLSAPYSNAGRGLPYFGLVVRLKEKRYFKMCCVEKSRKLELGLKKDR